MYNPSIEYPTALPSKINQFSGQGSTGIATNQTALTYDASQRLITGLRDDTNTNGVKLRIDCTQTNETTGPSMSIQSTGFNLFTYRDANNRFLGGTLQEFIIYDSFKSSTDVDGIEDNVNDYFQIY